MVTTQTGGAPGQPRAGPWRGTEARGPEGGAGLGEEGGGGCREPQPSAGPELALHTSCVCGPHHTEQPSSPDHGVCVLS